MVEVEREGSEMFVGPSSTFCRLVVRCRLRRSGFLGGMGLVREGGRESCRVKQLLYYLSMKH